MYEYGRESLMLISVEQSAGRAVPLPSHCNEIRSLFWCFWYRLRQFRPCIFSLLSGIAVQARQIHRKYFTRSQHTKTHVGSTCLHIIVVPLTVFEFLHGQTYELIIVAGTKFKLYFANP